MYSLHKIPVSVLFIFLFSSASGSDPYFPAAGAAESGMSYSCVMRPGFWSSFHNQASLPFNTSVSFGFNYLNRFNISELGTRTAGLLIPAGKTSLGIMYSHFGYYNFKRQIVGLACGLSLSENIAAGVQIDYFSEKTTGEYSNYQLVTCEVGALVRASDKVMIGIHLFNPVPNSLRKTVLPSSIRAGAGIELSNVLFAGAEAELSTCEKLIFRTGFEYEVLKKFWFRGGFSTENTSFSFGLGYLLKFCKLDLSFATHERLGITSCASLIFKIH